MGERERERERTEGSETLRNRGETKIGGRFSWLKNEITICQVRARGRNHADGTLTSEGRLRIGKKLTQAALQCSAGHSAGCGHVLATAAFFSCQIGQSMHLATDTHLSLSAGPSLFSVRATGAACLALESIDER